MIPNKIYHFLGYNSLSLMIEQERKHWLLKTDKMKRLQDKHTGDVYQGKIDNMGSDIVIEASKLPLKVLTNETFQWDDDRMNYIMSVENSQLTYSASVNGLMFTRILSTNYPVNIDEDTIHHYRIQFEDCVRCLIPFGDSVNTDTVFTTEWIKTNTPPKLQYIDNNGNYIVSQDIKFVDDITNVTWYYPLSENLQSFPLTWLDENVCVTSAITEETSIGFPLLWFTCDQSDIGPSIKLINNFSDLGKQLMMVGNSGNESYYKAKIFVCLETNDTPDDTPLNGWYVRCMPETGNMFTGDLSSDTRVPLKPTSIHFVKDDIEHYVDISLEGNSKIMISDNDQWEMIDQYHYQIPLTAFENNIVTTNNGNALQHIFHITLDEGIPFTLKTYDEGYAGIRATSSTQYSDIQTRYPYNLNKWSGIPKWLQELPTEDSIPQHTIIYALHKTQNSVDSSPETIQTAALLLDPGKCSVQDPSFNLEQYNRTHKYVRYILENPLTEEEGRQLVSKRSSPKFGTTVFDYTGRALDGFKELLTFDEFKNEPWNASSDYIWYYETQEEIEKYLRYMNLLDPQTEEQLQDLHDLYDQWMLELLNHTAYHVYIDDYIHDTTGLNLMELYNRYSKYMEFIDSHPLSNDEIKELKNIYQIYGGFPIIRKGDLDNNGVVDELDYETLTGVMNGTLSSFNIDPNDIRGDVDLDGIISRNDTLFTRDYSILLITDTDLDSAEYNNPLACDPLFGMRIENPPEIQPEIPPIDVSLYGNGPYKSVRKRQMDMDKNGLLDYSHIIHDIVEINRLLAFVTWDTPYGISVGWLKDHSTFVNAINADLTDLEKLAADMDDNGTVTEDDIQALREYIDGIQNDTVTYPIFITPHWTYVDRLLEDFKELIPFQTFKTYPDHHTADYIWNNSETSYGTEYSTASFRTLYDAVLSQLLMVTAYRKLTDNYITDISDIFNNDDRGRVYVLSNDSTKYINNRDPKTVNPKPDRTVARICDIPTTALQLTGVKGLSPTQVVDKYYVRQEASYSLDDKDRLYNRMASRWVRPNALDSEGRQISTVNTFVFNTETELNRVDLLYHNNFRETINLVPMVAPEDVSILTIINRGSKYKVGDVGIIMIGGYAFNYTVTETDETGGVSDAVLTPTSPAYEIHLSNFNMANDTFGNTDIYGTSPLNGNGTGLTVKLFIHNYQDIIPTNGEIFNDLYAFVKVPEGIAIYSYIINENDTSFPKSGIWRKGDIISHFESNNNTISGSITSSDAMISTILPERRQITVSKRTSNLDTTTIDTLTTSNFINIIDENIVPYDISNVITEMKDIKTEVDLCKWISDGIVELVATDKSDNGVIEALNNIGLLHEKCHVFFRWKSTDANDLRFEGGTIYQCFCNYRTTDTKSYLPKNDLKWRHYVHSNDGTTVVWNTKECGVLLWIYSPTYNLHEHYSIDIDSKDLNVTRTTLTWSDFEIGTDNIRLVNSNGNLMFNILSNLYTDTFVSEADVLYPQKIFERIGGAGDNVSLIKHQDVIVGNWRLVYPRLNSFTFTNEDRGISYNPIEMQMITGVDVNNIGDIINQHTGFQVNQKTMIANRTNDGIELNMFNNETGSWMKV